MDTHRNESENPKATIERGSKPALKRRTGPRNIIRVESRTAPFVVVDKRPLADPSLSLKAKGLLVQLLSKPDDWRVIVEVVVKESRDGETSVRSAILELEKAGYVKRRRITDPQTGRVTEWRTFVFELPELAETVANHGSRSSTRNGEFKKPAFSSVTPDTDNPLVAKPALDEPDAAGPPLEGPDVPNPDREMRAVLKNEVTKRDDTKNKQTDDGWRNDMQTRSRPQEDLVQQLIAGGFASMDADALVAQFPIERVRDVVASANSGRAEGKIRDWCGYVHDALHKDWRLPVKRVGVPASRRSVARSVEEIRSECVECEARHQANRELVMALSESELDEQVQAILDQVSKPTRKRLEAGEHPSKIDLPCQLIADRLRSAKEVPGVEAQRVLKCRTVPKG